MQTQQRLTVASNGASPLPSIAKLCRHKPYAPPRLSSLRQQRRPAAAAAPRVVCQARRSKAKDFFRVQRGRNKKLLIFVNDFEVAIPQASLWLLALPLVSILGAALLFGPVFLGLSFAAIAIWFALSAGAIALFIPFLVINGLFFGALASFGFVTSMFPLVITGLAVAAGWTVANSIIKTQLPAVEAEPRARIQPKPGMTVEELEAKESSDRVARELREFDDLLAERDQEDTIKWRRRKS